MIPNRDISQPSVCAPALWRYGIAVLSALVAAAIRLMVDPILPPGVSMLVFPLAVVVSSRFAGIACGLAATAVSVPLAFGLATASDRAGLPVLALVGICLSFLAGRGRSPNWFADAADRFFPRRLVLLGAACLLLLGLCRLLYSDFERDREGQRWVAHTYQVLNATQTLFSTLQDAESATRAYLLTGEDRYLAQYGAAVGAEPTAREALGRLTAGNPAQQPGIEALDGLIAARLERLAKGIERRRSGNAAEAAMAHAGEGAQYMERIRAGLHAAEAEEQRLLARRTAAAEAQGSQMRWVLGLGTGSLLMLLGMAGAVIERDIRGREQARRAMQEQRAALAQSEEATRGLLEAASQAIVAVDAKGAIALVNAETQRMFGYAREELIGQPIETLIPEALGERHRALREEYRRAPKPRPMGLGMELTARRKDGSEFPVEAGLGCVQTPSGQLFVAYITDITERRRAGEALRKSERDLRRYMESAPAAIATFDREMRYLAVSRRYCDIHGLRGQEVLGHSYYEILPEIPERWRALHRHCLAGAVERSGGEPFEGPDGSEQCIRWEIQPWQETDGSVGGIVVFSEDITAQKHAEREILRLNASLEQRVAERTEQLEAANKEMEAFAYSVSHDLRAPLRGIDGWSVALLEDCGNQLNGRAREYLERVRCETGRLGTLIDEMLRLSRVTRAEMRRDAVDMTGMVNGIASRLRETSPGRGLEFLVESGVTASGDARLLEIALTNLLDNAVKFTGPRRHARIEFGRQDCQTENVFYVRDNGVGFDMAYAGGLFGAFQRMHKAAEFPGTGIGLATVQRVIHRHGGRMWAEAQPEKGATFYFTLGGKV